MEDNIIYIGKKPTMSYVLAVVTQLNGGQNPVIIKARGKVISKAVDVAEVVRNRFVKDLLIDSISIGTQEIEDQNKEKINVSIIEIAMKNEKSPKI